MNDLNPCFVCRELAGKLKQLKHERIIYYVECQKCGVISKFSYTKTGARNMWNYGIEPSEYFEED